MKPITLVYCKYDSTVLAVAVAYLHNTACIFSISGVNGIVNVALRVFAVSSQKRLAHAQMRRVFVGVGYINAQVVDAECRIIFRTRIRIVSIASKHRLLIKEVTKSSSYSL